MSHGRRRDKKLLISKQLEKRKDLIRLLFRACGDRTVGARFLSRERLDDNELENVLGEINQWRYTSLLEVFLYPLTLLREFDLDDCGCSLEYELLNLANQPFLLLDFHFQRREMSDKSTTKTVFEKIEAAVRPVTYPVLTKKFKWKSPSAKSPRLRKGSKRHRKSKRNTARARSLRDLSEIQIEEEKQEKSLSSLSAFTQHQDFISAYKVMTFIKQHNLLDKTLNDEDTQKVRQFFETELSRPSYRVSAKVMRLMHEAFNKCWERVIDLCEKADFTNEVRLFLSEREKAKACFLDVMLIFPDLIPEFWGGRHIVEISMPFKLLQTIKDQIYVEDDRSAAQDLTKSVEQSHISQTTEYTKTTTVPTIVDGAEVLANTVSCTSPVSQNTKQERTKSVAKTPKLPRVKQTKNHSKAEKTDGDDTAREQPQKKQDPVLKDTAKPKTPKPDSQQVQKDMKKEKMTLKVERPVEMDMRKRKIIELKQSEKKLEKTMADVKQRAKAVDEKKKPVPPQSTQEATSDEDEDDADNGREE